MLGHISKISEIWKSKHFRFVFLALVIIFLVMAGYKAIPYPQIEGAESSDTIYKVSFNSPLTLHFNQIMDKASVEKSFSIHPKIKGDFVWRNSKTLEFHPFRNLVIGDNYKVIIKGQASSVYKKSLGSDVRLNFDVTGPPYVKFMSPYIKSEEEEIDEESIPIVSSDQIITVMFDRPMQWPTPNRLALGENLLLINPPVEGEYRFLGTSAFQFIPNVWPMGTRFELSVPAGIPARDGGETEKEINWLIETSPLHITETVPVTGDENMDPNASIKVKFNQPVDLDQIRPGVNALIYPSNDLDAEENPKYDGFFNTEVIYGKDREGNQDKSILIFSPTFPYLDETEYRFVIKAGLSSPSAEETNGSAALGMQQDFEINFKTTSASGIKEFSFNSDSSSIFLTFNTSITVKELLKGLSFSPDLENPPGIILSENNRQAEIIATFQSNTEYTFELKAGILDANGDEIKKDYKKTFMSPSSQSTLRWESAKTWESFSQNANPQFNIRSKNTDVLNLKLCKISDASFITTNENQGWDSYKCYTEVHSIELESSDAQTVSLNLNEIFNGEWESSPYYLSVDDGHGKKIHKILLISDTVLIMKKSTNSLLVWATDILTGEPVSRMELIILSYQGEEIARGVTDGDGVYKITRNLPEGMYAIGKKNLEDEDRWVISNEYWSVPEESNGMKEWVSPGESRVFLITNKNAVSPGDSLYVKGIWRIDNDSQLILPEDKKVKVTLENMEQNSVVQELIPLRRNGSFDIDLNIPINLSNGSYYLKVYNTRGEMLSSNEMRIEIANEDKPFSMDWIAPTLDFTHGDITSFNLEAYYEIGMPAASLRGEWELYKTPYYFGAQVGGAYYSYSNASALLCPKGLCNADTEWVGGGEFAFDQSGSTEIVLTEAEGDLQPGYEYKLIAKAKSISNKEVNKEINFKVHPDNYYVGLSLKHHIFNLGDAIEGSLIAVTPQGNLIEGKRIQLSLIRTKNGSEGRVWFEKIIETESVQKDISIPINSKITSGEYKLKAESQDGKIISELQIYILSEEKDKLADDFAILTDQPEYFVGGKARILINYPNISDKTINALVTYERGGVLGYEIVDLTKPVTSLQIPITEEMTPNINISAIVINEKEVQIAKNKILIGKWDREIKLDIVSKYQHPAPNEEVTFKINTYDYQNRPVSSVVTLNLREKNQNKGKQLTPYDYFYAPRFSQVLSSSNITLMEDTYINKQIPTALKDTKIAERVEKSAYFNPVILTDENGFAEVTFTLPDEYLVWEINAIATNESKNFGVFNSNLPVKESLLIYPIAPAFVIPGDEIRVSAILKNLSNKNLDTKIELLADDIEISGVAKKNVFIEAEQSTRVDWNVNIGHFGGKKSFKLSFNSEENSSVIEIPIKYPKISETISASGLLSANWNSKIRIPTNIISNLGGLYVSLSGSSINILDKYLDAIKKDTYTSLEHLTSELIGKTLTYHPELSDMTTKEVGDEIQNLINNIQAKQRFDGGYALWDGAESSPWLTAYVIFGLDKANAKGKSISSAVSFLWNNLNKEDISDKLFILWALSELEQYDTRATIEAFQSREKSKIAGKAFLLMNLNNLLNAGQKSVYPYMERLQAEIVDTKTTDEEWIYFEEDVLSAKDTNIRSTAVALLAMNRLSEDNPLVLSIAKYLITLTGDTLHRFNSQEAVWIAIALSELIDNQDGISMNYTAKINVNEQNVINQDINIENANENYNAFITIDELKQSDKFNEIDIEQDGVGPLYFSSDLTYFLSNEKVTSIEEGAIIESSYYTLEDYNETQPLSEMATGNLYRGVITLVIPEDLHYVAVEEMLPAGLKALSFNPTVADVSFYYEKEELMTRQGLNWINNPVWNFDSYTIEDDRLLLYAEDLPAGTYSIDYLVQASLPGKYNHLPSSIRQLFNPAVCARTNGEWIEIK